jgi:hypothetical protein
MQVHIFKGAGRVFGFTEDSTGANLPSQFGDWSAFKTLTMIRGESQPGVNVDDCINDIEKYGLHLTDAHNRITEQVV